MGRRVRCLSDHDNLSVLLSPASGEKPKLMRWIADLAEFNVTIEHVPGTDPVMALADWLSRPNSGVRPPLP